MNQESAHSVKFCKESAQKQSRKMRMLFLGGGEGLSRKAHMGNLLFYTLTVYIMVPPYWASLYKTSVEM